MPQTSLPPEQMPLAYSYIRFSTPEQIKGDSLTRQTNLSKNYADQNNLILDTSLNLRDLGISAFDQSNVTRGALGKFLELVNAKKIKEGSYLLIENLDRLSRASTLNAFTTFSEIIRNGITIVTLSDNKKYDRSSLENNFNDLLYSIMIMSRANEESAIKSKRMRSSWDSKRTSLNEKPLTSRCPLWMERVENKFVLIPHRVNTVLKIIEWSTNGHGSQRIAKSLNTQKYKQFSNSKNGWNPSYIEKILKSRALYGAFQPHTQRDGNIAKVGQLIQDYYPKVIDESKWNDLQHLRSMRKNPGGAKKGFAISNIFSGLLKCGYCKGTMVMGARTKVTKAPKPIQRYVACSNARRGVKCNFKAWDYSEIEMIVISLSKQLNFQTLMEQNHNKSNEIDILENEISELKNELLKVNRSIKNMIAFIKDDESPSKNIQQELKDSEKSHETLSSLLEKKTEHLDSLNHVVKSFDTHYEVIKYLFNKITEADNTELIDIRLKLSAFYKANVKEIFLFPLGNFFTKERESTLRDGLTKSDFSKVRINKFIDHIKSMSDSMNHSNRILAIIFNNQKVLLYKVNKTVNEQGDIYESIDDYLKGIASVKLNNLPSHDS